MACCLICSFYTNNIYTCFCCKTNVCYECISKFTKYEKKNDILYLNYKCFYCRTINYIDIFNNDLNNFQHLFKQNLMNSIKQKEYIKSLQLLLETEEYDAEQEYYRLLATEGN